MAEDSINLKSRYKTSKRIREAVKKIEQKRQFTVFKMYKEEEVFDQSLLYLDHMFQQSKPPMVHAQDEDINSDEDLIAKNQKESLNDLISGIDKFMNKKKVSHKQELVRNWKNKLLTCGKAGSLGYEQSP